MVFFFVERTNITQIHAESLQLQQEQQFPQSHPYSSFCWMDGCYRQWGLYKSLVVKKIEIETKSLNSHQNTFESFYHGVILMAEIKVHMYLDFVRSKSPHQPKIDGFQASFLNPEP